MAIEVLTKSDSMFNCPSSFLTFIFGVLIAGWTLSHRKRNWKQQNFTF